MKEKDKKVLFAKIYDPISGNHVETAIYCSKQVSEHGYPYSDKQLYENALLKVKSNQKVIELLGEIEPIDKLAILEGEVKYTDDNRTVKSSIRIKGSTGKGRMDIIADRVNKEWKYKIINVRIKNPPEKKPTIEIIKTQKR